MATLKVINLERVGTLPGGISEPYDRAIVIDTTRTEPNILTEKPQPLTVYRGDLKGANAFVKAS